MPDDQRHFSFHIETGLTHVRQQTLPVWFFEPFVFFSFSSNFPPGAVSVESVAGVIELSVCDLFPQSLAGINANNYNAT